MSDWSEWNQGSEAVLKTYFLPYLDGAKIYNSKNDYRKAMCFEAKEVSIKQYSWLTGVLISSPLYSINSIRLKDGSCIGLSSRDKGASSYLFLDVNGGMTKPNVAGKDLFVFLIDTNNKIVPWGYNWSYEDLTNENIRNSCNKKAGGGGMACSAKIIADDWQMLEDYPW